MAITSFPSAQWSEPQSSGAAIGVRRFYIDYSAGTDEYTISDASGDAAFVRQADTTWLLTATPPAGAVVVKQAKRNANDYTFYGTG